MDGEADAKLVKVLETKSASDIALIKATLDAEEIDYFIQGENMTFIQAYDAAALMVREKDVKRVIDLLKPLKLNYKRLNLDKS